MSSVTDRAHSSLFERGRIIGAHYQTDRRITCLELNLESIAANASRGFKAYASWQSCLSFIKNVETGYEIFTIHLLFLFKKIKMKVIKYSIFYLSIVFAKILFAFTQYFFKKGLEIILKTW